MNRFENWFCSSGFWRFVTRKRLLPWVLQDAELGEHLLELGAGPGAATYELRRQTARVTCLEYDTIFVLRLGAQLRGTNACVVRGDAATLPFPDKTFSSAISILMLHHMRSRELQDSAFREVLRVLRPGGTFLAFEIPDGWIHRIGHIRSTFVPVAPAAMIERLTVAGFANVVVDLRSGAYRVKAFRPHEA
jgi:SAM-dependent methyltransferase